jgi:hypothetical protein
MGGGLSRFHSAHVLIMGAIIRGKCPTVLQQQASVQKLVCKGEDCMHYSYCCDCTRSACVLCALKGGRGSIMLG